MTTDDTRLDVDRLARVLHKNEDDPYPSIEMNCYCRRIATVDGSLHGPLDTSPMAGFTEDWGFTDPICEVIAANIAREYDTLASKEHLLIEAARMRNDLLDRLAAGVRDLLPWSGRVNWGGPVDENVALVDRAAVLALIEEARK